MLILERLVEISLTTDATHVFVNMVSRMRDHTVINVMYCPSNDGIQIHRIYRKVVIPSDKEPAKIMGLWFPLATKIAVEIPDLAKTMREIIEETDQRIRQNS